MHILAVSLLAILAGTLLLAKFKKDMQGKFFTFISWFFIAVGFLLFLGFIAGGICRMKHHCFNHHQGCRYEMMEKGRGCCPPQMMGNGPGCCPPEMMEKGPGACSPEMMGKVRGACPPEMMGKGQACGMQGACCKMSKHPGSETDIKESDLPKEVSASVAKNFPGYKISEVAKVETPEKGLCYEIDVNNGKEAYEVQISPKGDILNKQPLKKEKEEGKKDKD